MNVRRQITRFSEFDVVKKKPGKIKTFQVIAFPIREHQMNGMAHQTHSFGIKLHCYFRATFGRALGEL
jgi:hypothetical protein